MGDSIGAYLFQLGNFVSAMPGFYTTNVKISVLHILHYLGGLPKGTTINDLGGGHRKSRKKNEEK